MNKTQIETLKTTLNQRVENFYKRKSEELISTMQPSKETLKLQAEYVAVLKKVKAHNDKADKTNGLAFTIENDSWRSKEVCTKLTNYAQVRFENYGSTSLAPTVAKQARTALDKVADYVLAVTLGKETVDDMDALLASLLK